MTSIREFIAEASENAGAAVIAPNGTQNNVGSGQTTQPFNLIPRVEGEFVLGALVTIVSTLSASGGTASSVSGAVNLDVCLQQCQVLPAGGTVPRSQFASRMAIQEAERL